MRHCVTVLTALLCAAALADELPTSEELARQSATIGAIRLEQSNVFDLSIPAENNWLYRLANRLHIVTREEVIDKQLLFRTGDSYSPRLIDESARILRRRSYLYDADIRPVNYDNGVVDLAVHTRDVWTLSPELSVSRSGGENRTKFGLEDSNLLGRGQFLSFARIEDVDRSEKIFEFADPHLGNSWVSASLTIADNSDGRLHRLSAQRPFYALDTRWSAGVTLSENERREALYRSGDEAAEYRRERDYVSVFGGWSKGLQNDWVNRFTAGFVYDNNRYSDVPDPSLPQLLPADRKLVYPFIGIEVLEDNFETAANRDQIGQTEDFYFGSRLSARLGWASESFGADRDAILVAAQASRGFGSLKKNALLLSAGLDGRIESGNAKNMLLTASARYYKAQSAKHLFFMTLGIAAGQDLDLDNPVQIGGNSGLRGYPLRYQSGEAKVLFTIEQRYFTEWYPFRLVRIGAAVFADAGRTFGDNPVGPERSGWLKDVGIGLRFAPTRSGSGKMIHLDIALPLDGDDSIDSVQILLESKRSF